MTHRIVVAHPEARFGDELVTALTRAGYQPRACASPYDGSLVRPEVLLITGKRRAPRGEHANSEVGAGSSSRLDAAVVFLTKSAPGHLADDGGRGRLEPRALPEIIAAVEKAFGSSPTRVAANH